MGEVSALTEVSIGARVGAHNDWLEVLVNFGLIGLCSLLSVHLSIIFGWLRSLRARSDVAIVFSVVVVMLFVAVSCSMVSNSIRAFILFVVVGHLMALSSTGVVSGSGVKRGWRLAKQ
jgi:O-antigen ligase